MQVRGPLQDDGREDEPVDHVGGHDHHHHHQEVGGRLRHQRDQSHGDPADPRAQHRDQVRHAHHEPQQQPERHVDRPQPDGRQDPHHGRDDQPGPTDLAQQRLDLVPAGRRHQGQRSPPPIGQRQQQQVAQEPSDDQDHPGLSELESRVGERVQRSGGAPRVRLEPSLDALPRLAQDGVGGAGKAVEQPAPLSDQPS